jgi:sugar phosphate isomerase/epimerase
MEKTFNRRDFITLASCMPVAIASGFALNGMAETVTAQAPVKRGGGPRLKLGLNAYSFMPGLTENLKDPAKGLSLYDVLDYCAEQNVDAIDPTGYFFPGYPKVPTDKYLNDFKRRAFQFGLDISGTGVKNNFASPDKALRAADVQLVKEWIECAARLGAPVLRVFAGPMPEGHAWDEVAQWMADEMRKCVEHGQEYGVLVGVQNHGDALKTADEVLTLINRVDSDWLGVVVDTGSFLSKDPYEDIARVAPHAVNWQVKEYVDGTTRKSKTDVKRLVKILRDAGYRGYVPIETLPVRGVAYDPKERVGELLKELRTELGQMQ